MNKFRYIAGEKLEKPPLVNNDPDIKFPQHQDIEVLPADTIPRAKWVMHEEIGIGVINPRGITQIITS